MVMHPKKYLKPKKPNHRGEDRYWEVLSEDEHGLMQLLDEHGQQFGANRAEVMERCVEVDRKPGGAR